jgi:hypothetical protein
MGQFATEKRNAAISQNWISRRDGGSNENGEPRACFSPGVPELSLILGSRQAVPRGIGGWDAVQPAHKWQQHLGRGMGCLPNNTTLGLAHCHIPLCVRTTVRQNNGPVLRYTKSLSGVRLLNANASVISCTPAVGPALVAHAGSGLADTVNHCLRHSPYGLA